MYEKILLAIDNSEHSDLALGRALQLAKSFSSTLVGAHVYAARLHDSRFQQMEPGLRPKYGEDEMERQRETHRSLIGLGLGLISQSYLDAFEGRCSEEGIRAERRMREGRNYLGLSAECGRVATTWG